MTRDESTELALQLSHALFKENDADKRYEMYVLQESLLTEYEDLGLGPWTKKIESFLL